MKKIKDLVQSFWYVLLAGVLVFVIIFAMSFTKIFEIGKVSETSVSGVMEKVKQISQLDTVEMYFNEIIDFKSAVTIGNIELPFTEKTFIFTVKAKVQSGIDLSGISEEDILIEDKKITLTLDRAVITSKEILEYNAYSEQDGLFNPITNSDTLNVLNEFRDKLEKQALDNGILDKAEENAKMILENIFLMVGFEEVVIKFK